ncbi:MAG: hypothetical protein ACI9XO_003668 [Paraglaciecola sp.]|jgi:hypothetical protein
MYTFWNTILFHQPGYKGNAFSKHADLAVEPAHFQGGRLYLKKKLTKIFKGILLKKLKIGLIKWRYFLCLKFNILGITLAQRLINFSQQN